MQTPPNLPTWFYGHTNNIYHIISGRNQIIEHLSGYFDENFRAHEALGWTIRSELDTKLTDGTPMVNEVFQNRLLVPEGTVNN